MPMVRTNVTLPPRSSDEIDEMAGPRGRSAYVAEAVQARLKRDRMRRILDETYGAAVGHSQWKDAGRGVPLDPVAPRRFGSRGPDPASVDR